MRNILSRRYEWIQQNIIQKLQNEITLFPVTTFFYVKQTVSQKNASVDFAWALMPLCQKLRALLYTAIWKINMVAYASNQIAFLKTQINKILNNSDGRRIWSHTRMCIQHIISINSKIFCCRGRVSPYNPFPLLPVMVEVVETEPRK